MAKYYYNGVLLPEIPEDVLASYPYVFIGFIASTGKYQILASANPMYFNTSKSQIERQNSNTEPFLYCMESDEAWTAGTSGNYIWSIDSDRQLVWSNHDIPNGSEEATEVYFHATGPIKEEEYESGIRSDVTQISLGSASGKFEFGTEYSVNKNVTALGIRVFFPSGAQVIKGTLWDESGTKLAETNSIRCNGSQWWSLAFLEPISLEAGKNYVVSAGLSSYHHILAEQLVFSGAVSFVQSRYISTLGSFPSTVFNAKVYGLVDIVYLGTAYETKYLIRSDSTLYTVADGALSALTETEVTASLFQTYGVDEIPDGALLVGLTDPEVLFWHDSQDELPTLSLTVKGTPPLPQVFTSEPVDLTHESIAGISHAAVDASEDVRFAISFDGGTTWKAFDGSAWFDTSDTVPGMLPSTMNAITAEQWAGIVQLTAYRLRFWLPNVTAFVKSVVIHYINP